MNPTTLGMDPATDTVTAAAELFLTRYRRNAPGMPESSALSGMNGVNASSAADTGSPGSSSSTVTKGYSPTSREDVMWGRPATSPVLKPWESA